ncbi:MAG TPA: hypothetical protein VMD02_00235, partial [Candidatus Omnitrophota bacterium]|nr:hypothetical protein [Candidatus Omnitrophota bacterium]
LSISLLLVFALSCSSMAVVVLTGKEAKSVAATTKKTELRTDKSLLQHGLNTGGAASDSMPAPESLPSLGVSGTAAPSTLGKTALPYGGLKPTLKEKDRLEIEPPLQIGVSLGVFSSIPAFGLGLVWNRPMAYEPLSIKTGILYAEGKDSDQIDRKNLMIFADGVWRLGKASLDVVGMYLGAGANCLVMTTGRVQGQPGGEVYVGFDSKTGRSEFIYAELGYGAIRTGFSPTYKGLNAVLGVRSKV